MWKRPFYLNSISKLKMVATIFPGNNPDYENKNFTLIIVCNQHFQKRWESDSKMSKTSPTAKKTNILYKCST